MPRMIRYPKETPPVWHDEHVFHRSPGVSPHEVPVMQAARRLGVSRATINNYQRTGVLPRRLTHAAIEALLRAGVPAHARPDGLPRGGRHPAGEISQVEASTRLGVSIWTVQRWQRRGLLPTPLTADGVAAAAQRYRAEG
jgi:hypothetical protein